LDAALKLIKAFDGWQKRRKSSTLSYFDEKGKEDEKEDENIQVESVQRP
jgi:hypothetical protein